MKAFSEYLKPLAYLVSSDALAFALPTLFSIVMGRYFGADLLGEYTLALLNIALALTLIDGGFDVSLARELAVNKSLVNEKLKTSHEFRFNVWLITLPILFIDGIFSGATWSFSLLLIRNLFIGYNSGYKSALRACGEIKKVSQIELDFNILLYPCLFAILFFYKSLFLIFLCYLLFEILKLPVLHKTVAKSYNYKLDNIFTFKLNLKKVLSNLKERASLIGINFLSVFQYRAPIKSLGYFSGNTSCGDYSAGMRFLTLARIIPGALLNLFIPEFTKNNDSKKLNNALILSFIIGLIISVVLYFSAPLLIAITYNFSSAVPVLQILSWTFLPVTVLNTAEAYLISNKMEKKAVRGIVISCIVSIFSAFYLIKIYGGAVGAAWAALTADVVLAVYYLTYSMIIKRTK